jgi:hypothetical protein
MHFDEWSRGEGKYGPQRERRKAGELARDAAREYWSFGYDPTTGVVLTTSWFGSASYDHERQAGRMTLIDGRHLKALLKKYLNMDILLSLSKTPSGWDPSDIAGGT